MAPPRPANERDVARKLRVEDGKSFPEVAAIIGVNHSTVVRWAQAEGWPDPREARRELKRIVDQTRKKTTEPTGPGTNSREPPPAGKNSKNFQIDLPPDLPDVNFESDAEALGDQLFRWSMKALQSVARFSVPTLVKFAEISARVHIALHTPKPGEERRLTVMVPAQTESYRGAPDE